MNALVAWLHRPFHLLDTIQSRWMLIIFCGIFDYLFLTIFVPFNLNHWFNHVEAPLFIVLTFFPLAGMAALAFTQLFLRRILNVRLATRAQFAQWMFVDLFAISIAVHAVDIYLLNISFLDLSEYLENLKHTLLVAGLPYFTGILLLYLQQQLQVVEELSLKVRKHADAVENVSITDENGKVAVKMPLRNIVYFKSEDNYILLYYRDADELKKELIRTTLKKLEQDLNLITLVRIHRSYMINSQNLVSAIKTPRGYKVKMDAEPQHHLPVSATYHRAFEEKVVQL